MTLVRATAIGSRSALFALALFVAVEVVLWRGHVAAGGNEVPWISSPPVVSGAAVQGGTLTASGGDWHGAHIVFTYTWERCRAEGAQCVPVLGGTDESTASSDAYVLTQADVGREIEVVVVATDPAGSASAVSAPTAAVASVGREVVQGVLASFAVPSPAVGRTQEVYVYLPPGYQPNRLPGYPVLYLLHGYPGGPGSFVGGVPAGPTEDTLLAQGLMRPTILVMPHGTPDAFTETSWVNGIGPDSAWETFLAGDVVGWVDSHFDTVRSAAGRAIAGLSDGGYGALNIALHHPNEFGVVESWSGYAYADPTETWVYGNDARVLSYNSPAELLADAGPALRRAGAFFWLSVGWQDSARFDNAEFASELAAAGIPFSLTLVPGSHLPSVYRAILPSALEAFSRHLGRTNRPPVASATNDHPVMRFTVSEHGPPDAPTVATIADMHVRGGGTLVLTRRLSTGMSSAIAVPRATGTVTLTLGARKLRLALRPNAAVVHTAGDQSATLLALPVSVTASTDPRCPVGASGYVDLEQSPDASGPTNTLALDLRSGCALFVGYDNAAWRNLAAQSFRLRLHGGD